MSVTGTPAVVSVSISSTLNAFRALKRYARGLTIAEFKCKLELVVGSPASCMDLELYTVDDQFVMKLDSDDALLGSYPIDDGCRIHVIDRSGATIGEYEDASRVEKFEMPDDEYDKRTRSCGSMNYLEAVGSLEDSIPRTAFCPPLFCKKHGSTAITYPEKDTARSFMKRSKLGQYNKEEMQKKEAELEKKLAEEKVLAEAISVGARCEVRASGQPDKRGTVMFVGLTEFKPGYWIGIKYDEPLGKHDGSVSGKRYFECQPKYGAFVKPQYVAVGDFPEEDDGLEDEM